MDLFWRVVFIALDVASVVAWQRGHYLEAAGWVLLLIVAWGVRVYFWSFAPCWSCKGSGMRGGSTARRSGPCVWCKGTGRRQVLGSRQVHKAVRGIRHKAWKAGK